MKNYIVLGKVDTPDSVIEWSVILASRYLAAKWKWLHCGIPTVVHIAKNIIELRDCDATYALSGGLCVRHLNGHAILSVDKRLAPANALASAPTSQPEANAAGEIGKGGQE